MIENFSLKDQWISNDHQDKELFDKFLLCIEFIKNNIPVLMDRNNYNDKRKFDLIYEDQKIRCTLSSRMAHNDNDYFLIDIEKMFVPRMNSRCVVSFYNYESDNIHKWAIVFSMTIINKTNQSRKYPMLWTYPKDLKWFCTFFHFNKQEGIFEFQPETFQQFKDREDISKDIIDHINGFGNQPIRIE